jgi:hypothetical protein
MTMDSQAQAIPSKARREPWNKGKLIGQNPPFAAKACLVDPYPIADGRTDTRFGNVQSGNR